MAVTSSPRATIAVTRGARGDERVAIGDWHHRAGSRVRDDEPLRARVQRRLVDLDRETVERALHTRLTLAARFECATRTAAESGRQGREITSEAVGDLITVSICR